MKKLRITLPILLISLITFTSCMKNNVSDDDSDDNVFIENLDIDQNFDWSMIKTLNISITLPVGDIHRAIRIYTQDLSELLYIGYAQNDASTLTTQITIPSHLEMVKVFYGFEDIYDPFEIGIDGTLSYDYNSALTNKHLKVADCGCDGGLVTMTLRYTGTSAANIEVKEKKKLKLVYSGTVQPNQDFSFTGTKKDGKLDNTIYVYIDGEQNTSIHTSCSEDIEIGFEYGQFTIAAGSNKENLSLCGSITDPPDPGDNGGSTTTVSTDGSLAFEDLWPSKGDYDFNDLVIDYDFSVTKNENEEVLSISADFIIEAFGASFHNSFGFQLLNVGAGNIISVTGYEIGDGGIFSISNKGLENNQSVATIIVFDDTHDQMVHPGVGIGVNTTENAPFVTPDTISVQMVFYQDDAFGPSGSITYDELDIGNFNPFIVINQNRGREVHLPDFPPTDLADMDVFGTFNDASVPASGYYYKSNLGLPWAINTPVHFDYPFETKDIVRAHLRFGDWAESSGQQYQDWYLGEAGYRADEFIYSQPN